MEVETGDEVEQLRDACVEARGAAAERALLSLGFLVCGILAVRQGEAIGHLLSVLGVVFAWLARAPVRELRHLRAALREAEARPASPGAN